MRRVELSRVGQAGSALEPAQFARASREAGLSRVARPGSALGAAQFARASRGAELLRVARPGSALLVPAGFGLPGRVVGVKVAS